MKAMLSACIFSFVCCPPVFSQKGKPALVMEDIQHFWQAYDKIITTTDSTAQYTYLNELFIRKGTPGLKAIMQVRQYTAQSYIDAIHQYPQFWKSIRPAMAKIPGYAHSISLQIGKLKKLYPPLRPAKIYFTVGAFRTGGTTLDSAVLIGSEIAMADAQTNTTELVQTMPALATYLKTSPVNNLIFTNVHEYVHTQQKITIAGTLAGQCLLEGVAEFVATKATGKASTLPAIGYGNRHREKVSAVFATQLFNRSNGYWLYSNEENEFGNRDMGYYVGYAICEAYYRQARNKQLAIKEMTELDYDHIDALSRFLDSSHYFTASMQQLQANYEKSRPYVVRVSPLEDSVSGISPSVTQLTIHFSTPMDKRYRNFDLGPLGQDYIMRVQRFVGFSDDGRSATIEVALKPSQQYQLLIGEGFRTMNGVQLKPYLIDFKTSNL